MTQVHEGMRGRRNGRARGVLKSRASDVMEDFSELRKDMARLADAANKVTRAEMLHAGKRLERIGRDLSQRAGAGVSDLRQRAGAGVSFVSDRVRTHPVAAIAATVGAGLAIGMLLRRRG